METLKEERITLVGKEGKIMKKIENEGNINKKLIIYQKMEKMIEKKENSKLAKSKG